MLPGLLSKRKLTCCFFRLSTAPLDRYRRDGNITEAQYRALRELGCTQAQGYLFARPLPAPEVSDWLERYRRAGNRNPDVPS